MIIQTRLYDPEERDLFINSALNCGYIRSWDSHNHNGTILALNLIDGHLYVCNTFAYNSITVEPSAFQQFLIRPVKYFNDIEVGDVVEYFTSYYKYNETELVVGNSYKVLSVKETFISRDKIMTLEGIPSEKRILGFFLDVVQKNPEKKNQPQAETWWIDECNPHMIIHSRRNQRRGHQYWTEQLARSLYQYPVTPDESITPTEPRPAVYTSGIDSYQPPANDSPTPYFSITRRDGTIQVMHERPQNPLINNNLIIPDTGLNIPDTETPVVDSGRGIMQFIRENNYIPNYIPLDYLLLRQLFNDPNANNQSLGREDGEGVGDSVTPCIE